MARKDGQRVSRDSVCRFPPLCHERHGSVRAVSESRAWVGQSVNESLAKAPPQIGLPCPFFVTSSLASVQSISKPGRRRGFPFLRRPGRWRTFRFGLGADADIAGPGLQGRVLESGSPRPSLGVNSGRPRFRREIRAEGACLGVNLDWRLLNLRNSAFRVSLRLELFRSYLF